MLRVEGSSSATQWLAGMRRHGPEGRLGIVLPPHTHFGPLMETSVSRLADHDRCLCRHISAGLEARGTGLLLCFTPVLPLLPSPQDQCWRKASCHHPSSCRRHSDTWWVLSAITRRSQKPLVGKALIPAPHRASGLLSQSIPPGAKIHHFPSAQNPGHWGPLETGR